MSHDKRYIDLETRLEKDCHILFKERKTEIWRHKRFGAEKEGGYDDSSVSSMASRVRVGVIHKKAKKQKKAKNMI